MRHHVHDGPEALHASLRRPGGVQDEAGSAGTSHAARQATQGVHEAHGLRQPRRLAVQDGEGSLRRLVPWTETRATGRDHEAVETVGEGQDGFGHGIHTVSGDRSLDDRPALGLAAGHQSGSRAVLTHAVDHAVRNGQHLHVQRYPASVVEPIVPGFGHGARVPERPRRAGQGYGRRMGVDELAGYEIGSFEHGGTSRTVLRTGSGPAVIVMAEMPGITPRVADFGRQVASIGCTAVLPSLFGTPGRRPTPSYLLRSLVGGCVSREFTALMRRRTSPVTDWLRALGAFEHGRCGGPGIGAVGMCFTGGFALGMMLDDRMLAPVLSQPSLPLSISARHRRSLGISDRDLDVVKERVADGVCVLGLRFSEDSMAPVERFDRLREELGDGFIGVELDSSPGNLHRISKRAHSVLTEELVHEPDHPTMEAMGRVLTHLGERLLV